MKRPILTTLVAVAMLCGCATGMTPEAKLKQGFDSVTAGANTATRLLDAHQISSDQAKRVLQLGTLADQSLKAGEQRLIACRARQEKDCSGAVSEIDMGSGILLELEKFLDAQQINGGP